MKEILSPKEPRLRGLKHIREALLNAIDDLAAIENEDDPLMHRRVQTALAVLTTRFHIAALQEDDLKDDFRSFLKSGITPEQLFNESMTTDCMADFYASVSEEIKRFQRKGGK